jgi:hypothetical protein
MLAGAAWWLLLLPLMVHAWYRSHFQYDVYLPGAAATITPNVLILLAIVSAAMIASFTWFKPYAPTLVWFAIGYTVLALFHGLFKQALGTDGNLQMVFESVVVAFLMLPIISDRNVLHRFLKLNFTFGIALIALNMVTVLHWLQVLSLPNRYVTRYASEDIYATDPLHFGLFGLTENFPYPGHPFGIPRLQGFSFEPIHWAYFVLLTLSSGLFVLALERRPGRTGGFAAAFALIAVHLFFVYSSAALFAFVVWLGVLALFALLRRTMNTRRESRYAFLALVITPGFIVPFIVARIPSIAVFLIAEDVLNKGSNWESKVGFLGMGSALYTRFFPMTGEIPAAGHNLVLSTYLQFGYFLTVPLLLFLAVFLKRTFHGTTFPVLAAGSLAVLAHSLLVPPLIFYPTGAMWLMMAAGVVHHMPGLTVTLMPALGDRTDGQWSASGTTATDAQA